MITIGTMNASATTMISCFGVLIGEECWSGSVMGRVGQSEGRRSLRGQRGQTRDYTVIAAHHRPRRTLDRADPL